MPTHNRNSTSSTPGQTISLYQPACANEVCAEGKPFHNRNTQQRFLHKCGLTEKQSAAEYIQTSHPTQPNGMLWTIS